MLGAVELGARVGSREVPTDFWRSRFPRLWPVWSWERDLGKKMGCWRDPRRLRCPLNVDDCGLDTLRLIPESISKGSTGKSTALEMPGCDEGVFTREWRATLYRTAESAPIAHLAAT